MDIKDIKGFLDEEGRVTLMPTKRRKQMLVLAYIAGQIPPDRSYTEREFNDLLNTLHTFSDPATLRRELYDHFLIDRSRNGDCYTLAKNPPTAEELIEKYCC